jgi:hypothetical protein
MTNASAGEWKWSKLRNREKWIQGLGGKKTEHEIIGTFDRDLGNGQSQEREEWQLTNAGCRDPRKRRYRSHIANANCIGTARSADNRKENGCKHRISDECLNELTRRGIDLPSEIDIALPAD